LDCRPTEEEVARLKKEILILEAKLDACGVGNLGLSNLAKRTEEKNERLQERLTQIEKANVDRWKEGYAAAQRQIAAWLRTQGPVNNLWAAETIESGYYREGEE
jgi:chromosome segregation ATPase